ncbi:MAG: hypothetical protein JO041_15550 [Acidobacteria bacterium]|nr:hypothetical protein [Acidobacteriota bacterium]
MKTLNLFFQWLFWMGGLLGLAAGLVVAVRGSWTGGITASMVCFGTMVPMGNYFKSRREVARVIASSAEIV